MRRAVGGLIVLGALTGCGDVPETEAPDAGPPDSQRTLPPKASKPEGAYPPGHPPPIRPDEGPISDVEQPIFWWPPTPVGFAPTGGPTGGER